MQLQFLKMTLLSAMFNYNVAQQFSHFFRRDLNKAFAEVTGERVNREAGCGPEVPCVYGLYGPKVYIDRMKIDGFPECRWTTV